MHGIRISRFIMGDVRAKPRMYRAVSPKGPKTGDLRKTPLSWKRRLGRRCKSSLSRLQHCLGKKYVVLLVKRGMFM